MSKAKRFLLEMGQNYTANSILQSELRVLKTLDFQVAILTPLDYVETILQVLGVTCYYFGLISSYYCSVSLLIPVCVDEGVCVWGGRGGRGLEGVG